VQAAAEAYFGKDVEHVTIAEAAMLAGLPKAPTKFSPYNDFERARERQRYVLGAMREEGYITAKEEQDARSEPLALVGSEQPLANVAAPYFVEHIRRWATQQFGEQLVFDAGLEIYTTVDMKQQLAAANDQQLAFLTEDGDALVNDATDTDSIALSWARLLKAAKRAGKKVRPLPFGTLRKTASTWVLKLSDESTQMQLLAHVRRSTGTRGALGKSRCTAADGPQLHLPQSAQLHASLSPPVCLHLCRKP